MISTTDRVSPIHVGKPRHNQSMITTGANGKMSKLGGGTGHTTIPTINATTVPPSGAITDLRGNSTPNKSNSMGMSGYNFKSNRENINLSRANLDR
jgi:hypothetical protein